VQALFLARGVSVTTDALELALDNQIPVILLDGLDHPMGLVWSARYGSIATIRRKQALFAYQRRGWEWLREEMLARMEAQHRLIRDLSIRFPDNGRLQYHAGRCDNLFGYLRGRFNSWNPDGEEWDPEALSKSFRGWEGVASKLQLSCLSAVMPPQWSFTGRSRRPALDPFNALLNYALGILYGQVELALIKAGLDPYLGVLHADRHQQPTLVFDVIERYRIWAESFVSDWFLEGSALDVHFVVLEEGGIHLSPLGKQVFVPSFFTFLRTAEPYYGQHRQRLVQIDLDALQLATLIRSET
jgi:CRISPR-associated protein Cas1